MLASITPLGERGRHMRWGVTVTAFALASLLAGALAGAALGAAGGLLAGQGAPGGRVAALALVAFVVAGLAIDAGLAGARLPTLRRQVDERWLARYRGWAYGAGFGLQLGAGVTTIVTTSAVYAALLAAFLCASPWGGLAVGATFGGLRGATALLSWRIDRLERLVALDRRLRAWDAAARRATLAVQLAVSLLVAAALA